MPLAPLLDTIPREIAAATDYEPFARARLDDSAWAYLSGGAGDEITLRENGTAFNTIRLRSRVLSDVCGGHTRLELFGQTYPHPVLLAPVAYQKLFHPQGELATATGADVMRAAMLVSTLASSRLEEIASATQSPLWFQLYLQANRDDTQKLVRRAEASGYAVLVVTVDAPIAGIRHREHRAGFCLPPQVSAVNIEGAISMATAITPDQSTVFDSLMVQAPTWQDIAWLASITQLPLVVKGILDADDAQRALDYGASGIIVSNHGGRILDTVPPSIEALPAIVKIIAGRVPVLLDGGIRRGGDIFKAMALGASAVLIGRPYIYALATAGALGVAHVLRTLRDELEVTMALTGCKTLSDIDRSALF